MLCSIYFPVLIFLANMAKFLNVNASKYNVIITKSSVPRLGVTYQTGCPRAKHVSLIVAFTRNHIQHLMIIFFPPELLSLLSISYSRNCTFSLF